MAVITIAACSRIARRAARRGRDGGAAGAGVRASLVAPSLVAHASTASQGAESQLFMQILHTFSSIPPMHLEQMDSEARLADNKEASET